MTIEVSNLQTKKKDKFKTTHLVVLLVVLLGAVAEQQQQLLLLLGEGCPSVLVTAVLGWPNCLPLS